MVHLVELQSGKLTTRGGPLLAELVPTPKIIHHLREWHPRALIAGWKYEVEGGRQDVLALARRQLAESRSDLCVANGPAYGTGFGLVPAQGEPVHLNGRDDLFATLEQQVRRAAKPI